MKKIVFIIVFIFFVFCGPSLFAEGPKPNIFALPSELVNDVSKTEDQVEKTEDKVARLKKDWDLKLAKFNEQRAKNTKESASLANTLLQDMSNIEVELDKLGTKVNSIELKVDHAQNDLAATNKKLVLSGSNEDLATAKIDLLRAEIKMARLDAKLIELTNRLDMADETLEELEREYDQNMAGAYIQDKIGQFVNSIAICKVRKNARANPACSKDKIVEVTKDDLKNELFTPAKVK